MEKRLLKVQAVNFQCNESMIQWEVCSDASLKNVLAAKGIAVGESPWLQRFSAMGLH